MTDEKGHIPHRFGADGNLRLYSYDRLFYSLYGYDGGATRTYKYSFDLTPNWVNERFETEAFTKNILKFGEKIVILHDICGHYPL